MHCGKRHADNPGRDDVSPSEDLILLRITIIANPLTISVNNWARVANPLKGSRAMRFVVREWKFGMLTFVLGLCFVTLAAINFAHWKRKRQLRAAELRKGIEKTISTSSVLAELALLQEERMVMHNLLRDIMENEALIRHTTSAMPDDERVRLIKYRKERRFELFGECLAVLGEIKPADVKWRKYASVK
jgi:hypothetical protein